jgi:hypothetical protein
LRRFALEGVLIQERRRIIVVPGKLSAILLRSFERQPVRASDLSVS